MIKGRSRVDEGLKKEVAGRLKHVFGEKSLPEVARMLDNIVSSKTLWEYVNGTSLPGPEAQIKISETFNVSLDWLLKGREPGAMKVSTGTVPYEQNKLRLSIEAVEELISAEGLTIDPDKKAELISIVYEDSMRDGVEEEEIVPRALRLLRLAT